MTETYINGSAVINVPPEPVARNARRRARGKRSVVPQLVLAIIALLMLFPVYFMVINALKGGTGLAASPFSPPSHAMWGNFAMAWNAIKGSIAQSAVIVCGAVVGIAVTTLLSGYAFARLRFREKEVLFYALFGLLLIPAFIVIVPLYVEIKDLGLLGSRWGLVLTYLAAGQALGVIVLRTFIKGIPSELFDAAKVDGAGHIWTFRSIVVPLSYPVVIALAVLNFVELWGDFVLPSLVLQGGTPTVSVAITELQAPSLSAQLNTFNVELAAFTLSSIPPAIVIFVLMRFFISGLSESAIKL